MVLLDSPEAGAVNAMPQELKRQWIDALNSGNYQQGKTQLRDNHNRYCCLGVLCDLIEPQGWQHHPDDGEWDHGGAIGFPSHELLARVGLSLEAAHYLADRNDTGWTFAEIARAIETEA